MLTLTWEGVKLYQFYLRLCYFRKIQVWHYILFYKVVLVYKMQCYMTQIIYFVPTDYDDIPQGHSG